MSQCQSKAIAENWQMILSEFVQQSEAIAQTMQRKGKLSVETFVQTLVLGCLDTPSASLSDFIQIASDLGVELTTSSLHDRITSRAVMLLASVFDLCLRHQALTMRLPVSRLKKFSALNIMDSTQITVSQTLYEVFCGNGNNAKMKVQLVVDYLSGRLQAVDCEAGRTPDQNCTLAGDLMFKDALFLFDLGYFKQETLRDMTKAQAFFVTRCQSQVALYDIEDGERVQLSELLNRGDGNQFEGVYRLGSRMRTLVRVVARRATNKDASSRRRHAKAKAKQQGKTCSQTYLFLLGWEILITNLDEDWTIDDLFILYGIRWQIEIIFKVWKSRLGVATLGQWRPARVMCQFYAHLIGAVLCHHSIAAVRWFQTPVISLAKGVSVIQHHVAHLVQVIRRNWYGIRRWSHDLTAALQRFAHHDKHKTTPTTLQFLMHWA